MKRILLVLFVLSVLTFTVFGQENQNETTGAPAQTANNPAQNTTPAEPAGTPQTTGAVDLGTIVLGASPYGRSLQDLPFNVTVINRQAIEDSGAMSIVDAAWNVPGVMNWTFGGYNSTSYFRIRNGLSKETVVAINGVRFINDSLGSANLVSLGAEMFESLEIMKGFGSLLYGPDGAGGVVNLVTRRAALGTHLTTGVQFAHGGLYGLLRTYVQGSFGAETFRALGSISYLDQKAVRIPDNSGTGFPEKVKGNSDANNTSSLVSFGFNNTLSTVNSDFTAVFTNSTYGVPGADSSPDTHGRFDKRDYIISNATGIKLSEMIELKFSLFFNHTKYQDYERSATGNDDIFRFYRYGADFRVIIKPVNKLLVTLGVSQTMNHFKQEVTPTPANNLDYLEGVTGVFLQADYSISMVQFTVGIRMDHHKGYDDKLVDFGTMFSPTFGVLVSVLGDYLKIRAQISKTHRIPLSGDYLGAWYNPVSQLNVEKNWNYEASLESSVKKIYTAKAVFFYQRSYDKIYYEPGTNWWDPMTPKNRNKQENIGFELEAVITPLGTLDLSVNLRIPLSFGYSRPKDLLTKKVLYSSNNQYTFTFGLEAELKMGLNIGFFGKYVKNYDDPASPYPDIYVSYLVLDAKIHYRFKIAKKDARVYIHLLNLANKKYAVQGSWGAYTMPGFTFMTGFEMKF